MGALGFRVGAAYSWDDIETARSVSLPGLSGKLSADYSAGTQQVFAELGYKIGYGGITFEPFGHIAYVNLHTDRFTEQGEAAALTSRSSKTDATFTTFGLRGSTGFPLRPMKATTRTMLGRPEEHTSELQSRMRSSSPVL